MRVVRHRSEDGRSECKAAVEGQSTTWQKLRHNPGDDYLSLSRLISCRPTDTMPAVFINTLHETHLKRPVAAGHKDITRAPGTVAE